MKKHFQKLCFLILSLALFIILWGAWVRFSHSGDGCGTQWPLCGHQWIPDTSVGKTWIEWIHRASSGIFGLLILFLTFLSFQCFPKKHRVRFFSVTALCLTITEALIGAGLVLWGLTGNNNSWTRLIVLNIHLINSLLLTASLVLCWRFSLKSQNINLKKILYCGGAFILIAMAGSLASLSNTLFPSSSLLEGWQMDWDKDSPGLVQFRFLHPLLAVLGIGAYWLWKQPWLAFLSTSQKTKFQKTPAQQNNSPTDNFKSRVLACLLITGLLTGTITLFSLSPTFMKIIHLLTVYIIWIAIFML